MFPKNCRIIIRKDAQDVGLLIVSLHIIFSDVLYMTPVATEFVPKLLDFE